MCNVILFNSWHKTNVCGGEVTENYKAAVKELPYTMGPWYLQGISSADKTPTDTETDGGSGC